MGLGQVVESTAHMTPAKSERDGPVVRPGSAQGLIGGIAVTLQDPAVATKQASGMGERPARGVTVDDGGRFAAAPRSVITPDGPEVALLGPPTARIEHRHD